VNTTIFGGSCPAAETIPLKTGEPKKDTAPVLEPKSQLFSQYRSTLRFFTKVLEIQPQKLYSDGSGQRAATGDTLTGQNKEVNNEKQHPRQSRRTLLYPAGRFVRAD